MIPYCLLLQHMKYDFDSNETIAVTFPEYSLKHKHWWFVNNRWTIVNKYYTWVYILSFSDPNLYWHCLFGAIAKIYSQTPMNCIAFKVARSKMVMSHVCQSLSALHVKTIWLGTWIWPENRRQYLRIRLS